jgi:hypothetical protein
VAVPNNTFGVQRFIMFLRIVLMFLLPMSAIADDFSGKTSMNDINFLDYKDFEKNWSLVTIRFRKDTGEMRLTYANEAAMKTLVSGSISYPDGAVFAKIGIHTGVDSQFISSVVPTGIRRYQFMLKDKKKYSATGGWGYGLFDPEGKTFAEEPKASQDACYACHTMVENRGDVFSQPFSLTKNIKLPESSVEHTVSKIKYSWFKVKDLPRNVATVIPSKFTKVRFITNSILRTKIFQGTLDEMKPILEHEVRKEKVPAILLSSDKKRFVIVVPTVTAECMDLGGFEITATDLKLNPMVEKYCIND